MNTPSVSVAAAGAYFSAARVRRRAALALPACVCSAIDSTCTLLGQSPQYWANTAHANEGNAMFAWLLCAGAGWFIVGELVWLLLVVGIIVLLPEPLALLVGGGVAVGHAYGALTWLNTVLSTVALYPVFALYALAPMVQAYIYLRPRLRPSTSAEAG